jgi:predicted DNA-binding transcriptional regulator AlpA
MPIAALQERAVPRIAIVRDPDLNSRILEDPMITVGEFAQLARLSRRQIDRLRGHRSSGFPREYELGTGDSKYRH